MISQASLTPYQHYSLDEVITISAILHQFLKLEKITHNSESPATNKNIFQIHFVSNLDICKIIIVCPGQHHVEAQVWSFENVSKI